jgi:hypothetical protein
LRNRENEQAIKDSAKATLDAIDATIQLASINNPSGEVAQAYLARTEEQATANVQRLEATYGDVSQRRNFGGYVKRNTALIKGFVPATSFVPYNERELAELDKLASETAVALVIANQQKLKLQLARQVGPPIDLMRTDFSKEEAARAAAPRTAVDTQVPFSGVPLTAFNENIQQAPGKMGGTSVSDLVGIKNPFTQHTQAVHDNTVAYHNWAEESSFAIGKVLDKHGMLSAGIMSLQTTTSKVIETALMRENWHRLKGVEVAKYAAGMTASALIGGIRDYAAAKVGQNIAQAVEWLSNPMTAALAPGAFASAAKWSLVAGVSGGVSAALASGASKGFDKSLGNPEPAQVSVVGGSSDVSSSSNPGVRIANSGASVGTINYNFIVTYQGATVYGDGGTRDWFQRELVPLINEGISAGSISRN